MHGINIRFIPHVWIKVVVLYLMFSGLKVSIVFHRAVPTGVGGVGGYGMQHHQ